MPFLSDEDVQIAMPKLIGVDATDDLDDDFVSQEKLDAAFRVENEVGSAIAATGGLPDSYATNPDFNPLDLLTDEERLDESFVHRAAVADNAGEIEALRTQNAQETSDRQKLESGAMLEIAIAAIASPITFIPFGGAAYKTYRGGSSILKGALVTGGASAAGASVSEAALHYTQIKRTYGESAVNVTAAALLGGILGATPAGVRKMLEDAGHDPDAALKDIEQSMNPSQTTREGGNPVFARDGEINRLTIEDAEQAAASLTEERVGLFDSIKAALIADSSMKISLGEKKALKAEIVDLEHKLTKVSTSPEPIISAKGKPARKAKKEAIKSGEVLGGEAKTTIQDMIDVANAKLERSEAGDIAEADLTRMEQGIVPERFKSEFDEIDADLKRIKQTTNTVLDDGSRILEEPTVQAKGGEPAGDKSVGAAEADKDLHIRGKVAKWVAEHLRFDPLTRTVTSELKETRIASSKLVENPMDMDRDVATSIESVIKTKEDGILFEAIDAKRKFFVEWKDAGGKGSERDFNAIVGKAVRNGSDDPIVQKAADSADKVVYTPGLADAVEVKLLDPDIPVKTAKNYLNRLWKKENIASDLPRFLSITSKWLLEVEPGLERLEADSLSKEIAGVIMSSVDGRLPYDYKIGDVAKKGGMAHLPGTPSGEFKARSFLIPDKYMEDFLENDIELLMTRYVKNTVPDIELIRAYDDVEMTNVLKDIEQGWIDKMEAEPDPKVRSKMKKKKDSDDIDMKAMRDRIRGKYKIPDADNIWVRMGRVAKDLNYMTKLGGVVAASIPDVGKIVMAEGIVNTYRHGLKPLVANLQTFKMSAREGKLAGVGTDGLMGGRAEIIADIADYAAGGTAFERGVRTAATKFSSINMMNQWTGGVKQLHAVMMQTRIANDLLKGVYDKRLGQLGINQADSTAIAAQLKAHGQKIDGVWVANTKDWTNPDLIMMWRTAIRKDSDRVVIVPGQEKPLFMSTQMGSVVGQFKTFMFSATQRILISNLQAQDKYMMQGMISMVSLGMMSYVFKQWDAGREITDDPMTLVMEGIDRSASLGILMEFNNTLEKISQERLGLRPLAGVSTPASRYASRSALDSAVGPTFGLLGNMVQVAGAAAKGEIKASDVRAIRRLIPPQNLSFARQGFDKLEAEVIDGLDIPK